MLALRGVELSGDHGDGLCYSTESLALQGVIHIGHQSRMAP